MLSLVKPELFSILDQGNTNYISENPPTHDTAKIHIWGGISACGTTILKVFEGNFNFGCYIDTLDECLLEIADFFYAEGCVLQEDNSPIHTSSLSKAWKSDRNIAQLAWPSNSPDLNPIENLWGVLKQRLSTEHYLSELKDAILKEWETFLRNNLPNLISFNLL